MKAPVNIFWFRRDLRLDDNAGLYHALKQGKPVVPVFVFDRHILDQLEDKEDRRVAFIRAVLVEMQEQLEKLGSTLHVFDGTPKEMFAALMETYNIEQVFTNHDYEPYATERDDIIRQQLKQQGVALHTYKDQVIFEKSEVVKDDGKPYTVFTPYSRRWKATITDFYLKSYPTKKYWKHFFQHAPKRIPSLDAIGFTGTGMSFPSKMMKEDLIKHYDKTRDIPSLHGTSRLGLHLRFGTISIRKLATKATGLNETFLNELIWRDFYHTILWHFPQVGKGRTFKPDYEHIKWRNNEKEFELWCKGMTGYPIVDAGMRELNETGFMHNRVRMVVASFLAKHLLIDWRWGEAYFAEKLLDYDLAANNGGWQWAAGSGCDAAPYFRVFNPTLQTKRFDPELKYVRKWVPELDEMTYPEPMVDHDLARKRCLEVYGKVLSKKAEK